MESKNEKNQEYLLLSPSRKRLPRACKSPLKQLNGNQSARKSLNSRSLIGIENRHTDNHLAADLLKAFPLIDEHFDVLKKVGEGTFSKVYLARYYKDPRRMVAIKHLIPTSSPGRIENELNCLKMVGGKNNVIGVECTLRVDDHVVFLLPYLPHQKFSSFFRSMKNHHIQIYMKNLFVALNHVHKHNIIHRDVKPSNFIYCKEFKCYSLIDFGLAMSVPGCKSSLLKDYNPSSVLRTLQLNPKHLHGKTCSHPASSICTICKSRSRQSAPRAGTPGFRSPEVLMKYPHQTTAVDMWSAGVILLCILSGRYPFFKAKDDLEAFAQIKALFKIRDLKKMASSIGKTFECNEGGDEKDDLKTMCEKLSRRKCDEHKASKNTKRKRSVDALSQKDGSPNKKYLSEDQNKSCKQLEKLKTVPTKYSLKNESVERPAKDSTCNKNELIEKCSEVVTCNKNEHMEKRSKVGTCSCIKIEAYDLLKQLLELDPARRISAKDALVHPFITNLVSKH